MTKNAIVFLFCGLFLLSCKTQIPVSNVKLSENKAITSSYAEDSKIKNFIAPYKLEIEGKMSEVVSHTNVDLTKKGDNSNLGNLLADYTYEGANDWAKKNNYPPVNAAVINIGGIRSTIGAGDILMKHIYEVMPFENEVVIVKLSGSDLQSLFDYYAETQKNNPISHLYIETDGGKITGQKIDGEKVNMTKEYYVATSDYLALGGDNMVFFKKGALILTGIKLRELFIEKFKAMPEVAAPTDVRILFKNKKMGEDE